MPHTLERMGCKYCILR
jgi:hypothetical protein